jgi:hypothetical protein
MALVNDTRFNGLNGVKVKLFCSVLWLKLKQAYFSVKEFLWKVTPCGKEKQLSHRAWITQRAYPHFPQDYYYFSMNKQKHQNIKADISNLVGIGHF